MGDIADAMIDGELDYMTGEYIGRGVGYPRTRYDKRPKTAYFTEREMMNGVVKLLYHRGIPNSEDAHKIIKEYAVFAAIVLPKKRKIQNICIVIQKDFGTFLKWLNATYPIK